MKKIIVFILSTLLVWSQMFSGIVTGEESTSTEIFLSGDEVSIRLSFEHYKMQDGWPPLVLSMGKIEFLLWMDETGRVSELREPGSPPIEEPVCVMDITTQSLHKGTEFLYFDVYEQNNIRTRWRLSSNETAGTMTKKLLFREKNGIDLCLGTFRLNLKHVAWDFKEFSPGLYHIQFHGATPAGQQPLVYEKATGMICSIQEWNSLLNFKQNHTKPPESKTSTAGSIPPMERAALIALYNCTNGDHWGNNSGWKRPPLAADGFALPGTEKNWRGITCDPGNTTVQSIRLYTNKLNGTLPQELGNLVNLQELLLSWNVLSGSIPSELGKLANLKYLILNSNQLSGSIPPELGNLVNLQCLNLSSNQLSNFIPPELGNLSNLEDFSLGGNYLSGCIPSELRKLTNLHYLDLSCNQLSGCIPSQLGNLTNLQYLFLNLNQLSGNIPPQLGNLAKLVILNLYENQLVGSIPQELGNLTNLWYLYLNSNQLSGSIPSELGNLTNLFGLWLKSNKLSGSMPFNLTNLTNLNFEDTYIEWNALYTNDDTVRAFWNSLQWGWENTQTIAPADVTATAVSTSSIDINWTPITYIEETGGYRIFYSTTPGGPYTYFGMTEDKTASSLTVIGLNPGTTYYFVVQTRTDPHGNNPNTVDSEYSFEVSATTLQSNPIITSVEPISGIVGTLVTILGTDFGSTPGSVYFNNVTAKVITAWTDTEITVAVPPAAATGPVVVYSAENKASNGIFFTVEDVKAVVDIQPDILNKKSKGNWLTAYIELPAGFDVRAMDISTLAVTDVNASSLVIPIYAELLPSEIEDYDSDGIPDLMVKFNRTDLILLSYPGNCVVTLRGKLFDKTVFQGNDTIRVIH